MYAISLTSIPPRFGCLMPVLRSLLTQRPAPERIYLCLPRQYRRFPGIVNAPEMPAGVEVLWSDADLGPATKVLPAARHLAGSGVKLIYCDDDWIMAPDWAANLLAEPHPLTAVTGQGFGIARLGRISGHLAGCGMVDVAQGYAGVLIDPAWLAGAGLDPPPDAWAVDDIWLSGQLARQGITIRAAPAARIGMHPAYEDIAALQSAAIGGKSRDTANRACAALLHARFGIWPESG